MEEEEGDEEPKPWFLAFFLMAKNNFLAIKIYIWYVDLTVEKTFKSL
jgi:hypothetical protein